MTFQSRIGIRCWPFIIIIIIHSFFYSRANPTCLRTSWRVFTHTNLTSFPLHGWYSLCQRLLSVDAFTKALKSHETPWKFAHCVHFNGTPDTIQTTRIFGNERMGFVWLFGGVDTRTTHIYIRLSERNPIESKISWIYSVRVSRVCWFCEHLRILQTNFWSFKPIFTFRRRKKRCEM